MRLKDWVKELDKVEKDIRDLEQTLRKLKKKKLYLWNIIMQTDEVRTAYKEYGENLRKTLDKLFKENR